MEDGKAGLSLCVVSVRMPMNKLSLRVKTPTGCSVASQKQGKIRVCDGRGAMLLAARRQHYIELRRENNEEMITRTPGHKEQ